MALLSWNDYRNGKKSKSRIEQIDENKKTIIDIINESSEKELLAMKGIGPKTASQIIENKPFADLNDLRSRIKLPPKATKILSEMS